MRRKTCNCWSRAAKSCPFCLKTCRKTSTTWPYPWQLLELVCCWPSWCMGYSPRHGPVIFDNFTRT
jgi:hypothetical protein